MRAPLRAHEDNRSTRSTWPSTRPRGFLTYHQRPVDAAVVVADGAVAVRPPDVLEAAVPLDGEVLVLVPRRFARPITCSICGPIEPDVGPELAAAGAECAGMAFTGSRFSCASSRMALTLYLGTECIVPQGFRRLKREYQFLADRRCRGALGCDRPSASLLRATRASKPKSSARVRLPGVRARRGAARTVRQTSTGARLHARRDRRTHSPSHPGQRA